MNCEICNVAVSKYKCSSCLVKYCSVPCYKIHKEKPCTAPIVEKNTEVKIENYKTEEVLDEEASSWRVAPEKLNALKGQKDITAALRDPVLQSVLLKIDQAPNRELALSEAMKDERFRDFADNVLVAVGVCIRGEDGHLFFSS